MVPYMAWYITWYGTLHGTVPQITRYLIWHETEYCTLLIWYSTLCGGTSYNTVPYMAECLNMHTTSASVAVTGGGTAGHGWEPKVTGGSTAGWDQCTAGHCHHASSSTAHHSRQHITAQHHSITRDCSSMPAQQHSACCTCCTCWMHACCTCWMHA